MRFRVIQDPVITLYERRVYSFLDFSGQLGGFFEILAIAGGFLVHSFANKLYYYSLFNKLYSVKYNQPDNILSTCKVGMKPKEFIGEKENPLSIRSKASRNRNQAKIQKDQDQEEKSSEREGGSVSSNSK